ncbi:PRKR-interacting protein 1 homolog [Macrobrachium rosenbergii]|uniref:PRKR-interacting protein 1 homolog n=1 Tax=Macrobrachium rosenbergii TaxID=79674 RepID=UPI0034D5BC0F
MSDSDSGDAKQEEKEVTVVKNATDLQRLKLQKLMKNPEKLAFIPDKPKEKKFSDPAEFVRNVMGSSAGAGSGEFHVYRHIRRREYARQEFLQELKEKDELDRVYHEKIKQNKLEMEQKAAKKRNKRQRQKEKQKAKRQKLKDMKKSGIPVEKSSSSSESSEDEEMEEELKSDNTCSKGEKVQNSSKVVTEENVKGGIVNESGKDPDDNDKTTSISDKNENKTADVKSGD